MDDYFYRAFFPPSVKILGYKLKPFCLGHILILQAIDSPVLKGDGEITAADLVVALKVCRSSYPFQPDLKPKFFDLLTKSRLNKSKAKLTAAAVAFDKYVGFNTSKPRFWKSESSNFGNELTSPSILSLVISLSHIGTQEEVWSMSLGKAVWYESVLLEKKGSKLRFFYESDIDQDLPDLEELSEEELFQVVVKDLGLDRANAWLKTRNQNKGN